MRFYGKHFALCVMIYAYGREVLSDRSSECEIKYCGVDASSL